MPDDLSAGLLGVRLGGILWEAVVFVVMIHFIIYGK